MNTCAINGKLIYPKRIFLHNSFWILEGKNLQNKTILINLSEICSFNEHFIDEVVIIRPLTNKIYVDDKTNDVLKVYVDQKDRVIDIIHENRFQNKVEVKLPDLSVNDAFVSRPKKKR